jgi:hypothetical protein
VHYGAWAAGSAGVVAAPENVPGDSDVSFCKPQTGRKEKKGALAPLQGQKPCSSLNTQATWDGVISGCPRPETNEKLKWASVACLCTFGKMGRLISLEILGTVEMHFENCALSPGLYVGIDQIFEISNVIAETDQFT